MSPCFRANRNRGFTLVELMISLIVFGVVVSGALGFLSAQNTAFHKGSSRITALTNVQFAMQAFETNIPTLGTNLVPNQPGMVYAEDSLVVFNADYATNAANDPFAVYHDPDAPAGQVTSPQATLTVPGTSFTWPATPFTTGGSPAPAELLMLGFYPDVETSRTDDYVLTRKVNNAAWEVVARNILKPSNGEPFFRYFIHRTSPSAPTILDSIPDVSLPQTSGNALADSIRAMRVSLRATNGLTGDNERIVELSRVISMPNAGLRKLKTCGDAPIAGTVFTAVAGVDAASDPIVTLAWGSSVDDGSGENDVMRYVIWRRDVTAADPFVDPLVSVPAGTGNTYVDSGVDDGTDYQYQVAAQDCTPAMSGFVQSLTVTIP